MPSSDENDRSQRRQNADAEDPLSRSTRQFDSHFQSLFDTLWSLPRQIYQRGNEHGREFGRLMDERQPRGGAHEHESRSEREDEQEREDARGNRACGWRGKEAWQHTKDLQRQSQASQRTEDVEGSADSDQPPHQDWVARIAREVGRNQQEAEKVYGDYERQILDASVKPEDMLDEAQKALEGLFKSMGLASTTSATPDLASQHEEAKAAGAESWSELFPAWSGERSASSSRDRGNEDDQDSTPRGAQPGPIVTGAQQFEDAVDQAQRDVRALMKGTSHIAKLLRDGYNHEARLWDEEGLFGAHVPFSRPLSTMLSLGMRPFVPEDSAMGYMLFNKYSPLQLEREPGFDVTFRRRFEDLIRVQSGGAMLSEDEAYDSTKLEWLQRMEKLVTYRRPRAGDNNLLSSTDQQPGDDEWPSEWHDDANPSQKKSSETAENEWDVYEQMLAPRHQAHERQLIESGLEKSSEDHDADMEQVIGQKLTSQHPLPNAPLPRPDVSSSHSVLSTLTTTERHVGADGTITEKTVLKKRFADGREETESTTTTTESNPAMAWAQQRQLGSQVAPTQTELENKIANKAESSRGWFWSS